MSAGDRILDQITATKYQIPMRRTTCPQCGASVELSETERGLHCVFCGWHESGGAYPKYIPRTPDST